MDPGVPVLDATRLIERIEDERPLVVLYYADWCGYCARFLPLFQDRAARADVDVVAVDLSSYDHPFWDEHGIDVVPSVIAFQGGRPVAAAMGHYGVGVTASQLDGLFDHAAR